ncbi:cell division protein SepF [Crossiella cryophila]|uniref:Cell division protein SepF n=1 Tax=Crossiella cryophila TaxID=43355 RepID=A0A7W7FVF4_9PSEU|nr:cell division protein SepF [Crossiella cryophila]MBB4676809.1 cell division inhibitor SepF [Crossiella cryophila]
MSALQKLKAYFGMVPADEVDRYAAEEDDRYRGRSREYADEYGDRDYDDRRYADAEYESYPERGSRRRRFGTYRPELVEDVDDYEPEPEPARTRRPWAATTSTASVSSTPQTRGALAVDSQPQHEPAPRTRAVIEHPSHPLSRITTLAPRSYLEARTIGEHYREGTPVIINLTGMADADARRLVDFAAGLAFALRGDIDKVTNKVFLLSPPNVDVTAEDRRRLAEGGYFSQS